MSLDRLGTVKRIGDSAILGASMAVAHAAAGSARQPLYRTLNAPHGCILPVPMFTVLHGGAFADCEAVFSNFMIAPVGAPSFREALHMGVASYLSLKSILRRRGYSTAVSEDGGFIIDRIEDVAALARASGIPARRCRAGPFAGSRDHRRFQTRDRLRSGLRCRGPSLLRCRAVLFPGT